MYIYVMYICIVLHYVFFLISCHLYYYYYYYYYITYDIQSQILSRFLDPLLCSCRLLHTAPDWRTDQDPQSHTHHTDRRSSNPQGQHSHDKRQMDLWENINLLVDIEPKTLYWTLQEIVFFFFFRQVVNFLVYICQREKSCENFNGRSEVFT